MLGRLLDNAIGVVSPVWAARRLLARATLQQMAALGAGGSAAGGYAAGKMNRLTKAYSLGTTSENAQPRNEISRLRQLSWDLYRNNGQARKIVRSLESKVIGRGLRLQSQATYADGTAHVEFRTAARKLWEKMQSKMDFHGEPGQGGQLFSDLCKSALRNTILGGEVLYRFRSGDKRENLPTTQIQLIHGERLCEVPGRIVPDRNTFFFGIELGPDERRLYYHFHKYHPSDPRSATVNSITVADAREVGHLYIADDIDQLRGVPWFSAALLKMRDVSDYEHSELVAAAVSACVVLGYRRSSGQNSWGLNQPDDWDLTDADGNRQTALQPGMLIDLGRTGEIQGFNPMRPNTSAPDFIKHLVNGEACAVPGMKGTTLTGDYKGSSFSTERAAENDIWPEIEGVQDWFGTGFCQPIYERVITSGVINGYFSGIITPEEFVANRSNFLAATWHGPVSRSINPTDDAKAARMRIQNGQSSPQIEAALLGRDWQEIVRQIDEFIDFCEVNEIPEVVTATMLGIDKPVGLETVEPGTSTDSEQSSDSSKGQ